MISMGVLGVVVVWLVYVLGAIVQVLRNLGDFGTKGLLLT